MKAKIIKVIPVVERKIVFVINGINKVAMISFEGESGRF